MRRSRTRPRRCWPRSASTFRPKGATAVVIDPRSGELLAVANWPRVDANDVGGAPGYARQNRAVGFTYEPGSTFKAVTVAGALAGPDRHARDVVRPRADDPGRRPDDRRVAPARLGHADDRADPRLLQQRRRDHDRPARGRRPLLGVGAALRVRQAHRRRSARARSIGLVLPRDKYSGSSMGNLPIGQGTSVTPMQMAVAYSAIANGGTLVTPHVVRRVGGELVREPRPKRVISSSTSLELRTMLEGVFAPGGTASEVSIPGYKLAGKTGTANKVDASTGEYSSSRYVASFVGFAPALRPRLLTMIVVDEPQGAIYGGQVAAPAFGQIMSFALSYLKIPPRLAGLGSSAMTLREVMRDRRRRRDRPPGARHARCGARDVVLLRARLHARRPRPGAARRSSAARSRWWSSARSDSACPRWSSSPSGRRWRRLPRASTATRRRGCRSSESPGRTARRRPRS